MRRYLRASRVLWLLVGLFSLCVAAIVALLVIEFDREARTVALHEADSIARGAEATLNRNFLAFDLTLAGLEDVPGLFSNGHLADQPIAASMLRALVGQRLLVRDLLLLDGNARVLAAAEESSQRLGVALPSEFFAQVLAQVAPHLMISAPSTSFASGDKVIHFARPIGPPGPGRLVAVATVPVSALITIVAPAVQINDMTIAIENERGVLLASVPANDSMLGRRLEWSPAELQAIGSAGLGVGRIVRGAAFSATRPTLYGSVLVTAAIPASVVLAASRAARVATIAIGFAFVVVALVGGALVRVYLTRLKAASSETIAARQVLEEALASMDEGFLLWDADDRVVSWNERYLALFPHLRGVIASGVGIEQIAEAGARAMLPDADDDARRAWIAARLAHRRADGREFEQVRPDGSIVSAVERRTASGGIVSIYRDVTQARRTAAELERAKRNAEAANDAKTRFLATMSHEIRTPLNGVLGMNDLLLDTALDATQRRYAETIRSSGAMLLYIINDILDMSRLEAGRMTVRPGPFNPVKLIDEIAALLGARAADKAISLTVEHDPSLPPLLHGDAGRIRQIFFNLVGNAIKFTEHGGVVIRCAHQAGADDRIDWTVRVSDSGIGIAREVIPGLFDRFTQADDSTSRRFGGSGLGLAISRELVQLMGGRIDFDSRVGMGSDVSVTLPLRREPAPPLPLPDARRPAAQPPDGLHVLVAEDNAVNQMLIAAMLEKMGHSAELVGDGRAALDRVAEQHYDLVLMDIQMPEMDGVAAARAIRKLPGPESCIPIISVSANVFSDQREAYLAAGMNDHVTKPIDQERLAAAIAGVMGREVV